MLNRCRILLLSSLSPPSPTSPTSPTSPSLWLYNLWHLQQPCIPPRFQALGGLNNVIPELVAFRSDKLLPTTKDPLAFRGHLWHRESVKCKLPDLWEGCILPPIIYVVVIRHR